MVNWFHFIRTTFLVNWNISETSLLPKAIVDFFVAIFVDETVVDVFDVVGFSGALIVVFRVGCVGPPS